MPAPKPEPKKPDPYPFMDRYPPDKFIFKGGTHGMKSGVLLVEKDMYCCGIKELHGIMSKPSYVKVGDPNGYDYGFKYADMTPGCFLWGAQKIIKSHGPRHRPFWIYSVTGTASIGDEVKDMIERNKWGSVMVTDPQINHNSGNKLRAYVWSCPMEFQKVPVKEFNVGLS